MTDLTAKQVALKSRIKKARQAIDDAEGRYERLVCKCTHIFRKVDASAECEICEVDHGWWCPDSVNNVCEYTDGEEYCIHCGAPEERE